MLKNIFKIIAVFVIGAVGGIFSEQIFWPYFIERPLFLEYGLEPAPMYIAETKEITIQENAALENAVEKTSKIAVGIQTKTPKGDLLRGSGLILTSDGLILSLAELFPKNSSTLVWAEGIPYHLSPDEGKEEVKILKKDLENNLCLLKIEANNLNTAGFFDFERIKLGQRVFLIGSAFDKEFALKTLPDIITCQGIVNYFNNQFIYTDISSEIGIGVSGKTIASLTGSPLFSIDAQVVGINYIDSKGKLITIPSPILREFIGF